MLFYSALHKAHTYHKRHIPNWFMFSDDDYFVRLDYLEAILDNTKTPPYREYALVPSVNFDRMQTAHNMTERPNYGLFR